MISNDDLMVAVAIVNRYVKDGDPHCISGR